MTAMPRVSNDVFLARSSTSCSVRKEDLCWIRVSWLMTESSPGPRVLVRTHGGRQKRPSCPLVPMVQGVGCWLVQDLERPVQTPRVVEARFLQHDQAEILRGTDDRRVEPQFPAECVEPGLRPADPPLGGFRSARATASLRGASSCSGRPLFIPASVRRSLLGSLPCGSVAARTCSSDRTEVHSSSATGASRSSRRAIQEHKSASGGARRAEKACRSSIRRRLCAVQCARALPAGERNRPTRSRSRWRASSAATRSASASSMRGRTCSIRVVIRFNRSYTLVASFSATADALLCSRSTNGTRHEGSGYPEEALHGRDREREGALVLLQIMRSDGGCRGDQPRRPRCRRLGAGRLPCRPARLPPAHPDGCR